MLKGFCPVKVGISNPVGGFLSNVFSSCANFMNSSPPYTQEHNTSNG